MRTRIPIFFALLLCTSVCAQTSLKITTDQPGNLFYVGQPVELKLEGTQTPVKWEVKDLDGKVIASGAESGGTIKPNVPGMGIYYITCRTEDGKASGKTSFAVLHKIPALGRPDSPFGINGGALFHIDLRDIPTVGKARLDLCQRLGVKWGRNDFWWGKIEPEYQKFDWRQADAAVEMYEKHGMNLMPIFCYSSAWHDGKSPDDDDEAGKFGLYAGELVGRYKNRIRYWEVWNEPNLSQFWSPQPNPADYARLLNRTRLTAMANDPEAKLVGCVTAGPDTQFIRKVLEKGGADSFDILSIHNYFWTDEAIVNDLKSVREVLKEFEQEKPIWITEIGWPTGANWMTEEDQARMLVRVFTLSLAEGVERIFYYNSTDYQPYDSGGWDGRTGLFDEGTVPKAAAVAYNELIWQLEGMKYGGKLNIGKGVYGRYFVRDNEQTAVIWTTEKNPVAVELPCDMPEVVVIDMLGRERLVRPEKGILRLQATDRPQYVKLRGTALYVLSATDIVPASSAPLLTKEGVGGGSPAERLFSGMEQELLVILKGMAALRGQTISLTVPKGWTVSPAAAEPEFGDLGERICRFTVRVPKDVAPGVYEVAAIMKGVSDLRIAKGIEVAAPVKLTIKPPSEMQRGQTDVQVSVENHCDRLIEGSLIVGIDGADPLEPKNVKVSPSGSATCQFSVPVPEKMSAGSLKITATMRSEMLEVSDAIRLDLVPVKLGLNGVEIDGNLDEWKGIEPFLTEDGGAHVDQKGKWSGKADHSVRAWVAWMNNNLYLAVDVTDDTNVWPGDERVWEADGLQVALDLANDAVGSGFDDRNDMELEIGKINGQDRIIAMVAPEGFDLSGAKIAIMAKPSGGAVYELMIPGMESNRQWWFQPGKLIGFSLLVNDNDGAGRKSWLELTPGIGLGKDPTAYKDLWLR